VKWTHGMAILEALLLASPEPLTLRRIAEVIGLDEKDAKILLNDVIKDYQEQGRGLVVKEIAGGFLLTTRADLSPYVEKLLAPRARGLSHSALETLSIIAYRQPITRAEIEGVRGVNVDRPIQSLLERRLIQEVGRKETPGRPVLYGTTKEFLAYFGLASLEDLPPLNLDTSQAGLIVDTGAAALAPEPAAEPSAEPAPEPATQPEEE
jgi:segregation and condensation protein B